MTSPDDKPAVDLGTRILDRRTGFEPASSSITLLNVRSVGGYRRIEWGCHLGIEPRPWRSQRHMQTNYTSDTIEIIFL